MSVKPLPAGTSPTKETPRGLGKQAWTNSPKVRQGREKRTKGDSSTPLEVVEIDQDKLGNNALSPVTGTPFVAANVADLLERVDMPAEVPVDPFESAIQSLINEHNRQIDTLASQLEEQTEKLNVVLSTTWGFSEEGWHGGSPNAPKSGKLDLICTKPGQERERVDKPMWSVTEEEQAALALAKGAAKFRVRPAWKTYNWGGHQLDGRDSLQRKELDNNPTVSGRRMSAAGVEVYKDVTYQNSNGGRCYTCATRIIAHPASPQRLMWDCLGMTLLLWDIVTIPLSAYDPARTWFMDLMDWTTLVFWSCDMVASFFTGFLFEGITILDPVAIAKNYLSGWFWLDLVVVGPDWIFTILEVALDGEVGQDSSGSAISGAGNTSSLLRALRVVRVLRLLRMAKMKRILAKAKDYIHSEAVFLIVDIMQFVVGLIFFNHLISAVWYLVGRLGESFGGENWIEERNLENADLIFRYFNSLHWSMSQFAPGWFYSSPNNGLESLFAITVLIIGMITCCYFTASLTNVMMRMNSMAADSSKQFWLMRRYLRQHHVEKPLALRVLRYLEYANSRKKELIDEERLPILGLLSEQLKSELKYVVHYGSLLTHPLFRFAHHISEDVMVGLVETVLSQKWMASSDMQFHVNQLATHMCVVVSGSLTYTKSGQQRDIPLHQDDWACEHALWVSWACRGNLVAAEDTQLILVDTKVFGEVMQGDQDLWPVMTCYAEVYVEWINTVNSEKLSDVSLARQCRHIIENFVEEAKNIRNEHEKQAVAEEEKQRKRQFNLAKFGPSDTDTQLEP